MRFTVGVAGLDTYGHSPRERKICAGIQGNVSNIEYTQSGISRIVDSCETRDYHVGWCFKADGTPKDAGCDKAVRVPTWACTAGVAFLRKQWPAVWPNSNTSI